MSSSIDNVNCIACNGSATREQYKDGFIEVHCSECGFNWTNEEIEDKKVHISWAWDDVQHCKPDWSEERCQTALGICSKVLISRSIEEGWQILSDLLSICEDEIEEAAVSPE